MIKRNGHYILNINDWNDIVKYFKLSPRTVAIKESPDLTFTEYQIYDIYSNKVLFGFYDHDGKIRIPGTGKIIAYELDISQILTKNPDTPAHPTPDILKSIKLNVHTSRNNFAQKIRNQIKGAPVENK